MAFMNAEVTRKQTWIEIDGGQGVFNYPGEYFDKADAKREYGKTWNSVRTLKGYGVRLSASGYLDCTDWEVYTNKREAIKRANELQRESEGEE